MRLILASGSPRRKELLAKLPYKYTIIPSACDEVSTAVLPKDICVELACRKAMSVFSQHLDSVVLGCDTVVDLNGELMGKPKDNADATFMLTRLSGKTHKVHTGVCFASASGVWLFCETTDVAFRKLTEDEIARYVDGGSAMDKAGAYGIQDSGFVAEIRGDYDNVVGLPTTRVAEILKQIYKR